MNALIRWGRFNLVGAMGMAVQLGALALFNRWLRGHYLVASAVAIELTLVHNFLWHTRYTWRDRSDARMRQFVRFQLSNGVVSLAGNLVLMRLLVHGTHLPVVVANLIAIVCCSAANFCLGNIWAFAGAGELRFAPMREQPTLCVKLQRMGHPAAVARTQIPFGNDNKKYRSSARPRRRLR